MNCVRADFRGRADPGIPAGRSNARTPAAKRSIGSIVKIDRSFVDRLGKDKESTTIIRAVLGLASGFNLETTAEGIENEEQLASLAADGCLEGQGYLFSEAVPASEVRGLLESHKLTTKAVA